MRYALLLLAFALPCHAEGLNLDKWTREDSYRQAAVTVLLVVDWAQTRYLVRHPIDPKQADGTYNWRSEGYNRVLGEHPSIGRVNNYFLAATLGHAAISALLPPDWRKAWQYVVIGVEANTVERNHHIGIKMEFF